MAGEERTLTTAAPESATPGATVRDATLGVLRELGLTTMFSNPGSTEIPFLAGLPGDLEFVLALHEGSVVGMATGWALSRGEPALVLLHTTAGLGNAVSAIATARVNRAPLVILVGQQDRRHLALQPFLAGRLEGLAGDYPVWVEQPARPQDVPGTIVRAYHEALTGRGPALVIVPMSDWEEPAPETHEVSGPQRLVQSVAADAAAVAELAAFVDAAQAPVLVVGAGADSPRTWAALVRLAERLAVPVWQEAFGARAGFPQDHPQFAGWLAARRTELRDQLAPHDAILVVGAPAFRQYAYDTGPMIEPGTRVALITDDADEAHRSPTVLTVLGDPGATVEALADAVTERPGPAPAPDALPAAPAPPAPGEPMRAGHVLAALGERLPRDAIVVEESPSSRRELNARLPAREPMGTLTAAMGGLGFALPGATGLRMGDPSRPVVAVVGDGSAMYQIQALWSAARYRVGTLFVILNNGGYAIMDWLVAQTGEAGPWPALEEVQIAALARGLGCEAERIDDHATLLARLDEVVPTLADRQTPLVLEVVISPDSEIVP